MLLVFLQHDCPVKLCSMLLLFIVSEVSSTPWPLASKVSNQTRATLIADRPKGQHVGVREIGGQTSTTTAPDRIALDSCPYTPFKGKTEHPGAYIDATPPYLLIVGLM